MAHLMGVGVKLVVQLWCVVVLVDEGFVSNKSGRDGAM